MNFCFKEPGFSSFFFCPPYNKTKQSKHDCFCDINTNKNIHKNASINQKNEKWVKNKNSNTDYYSHANKFFLYSPSRRRSSQGSNHTHVLFLFSGSRGLLIEKIFSGFKLF